MSGPRALLSRLAASRNGAVAVLAAAAIGLTGLFAALITDMTRAQVAQLRLQAAADAAALAAARETGLRSAALEAFGRTVFDAAMDGGLRGVSVTRFSLTLEPARAGLSETVRVSVDADLALTVLGLIDGIDTPDGGAADASHDLSVSSAAGRTAMALEVVMALDNTGSMAGWKIDSLRTAARLLVETLFGAEETSPNLHVGVVNYSATMNVGRQHGDWLDAPLATVDAAFAPTRWKGCVRARSAALGETDDPPGPGALFPPLFWPSSVIDDDPITYDAFYLANNSHRNIWPPLAYFEAAQAAQCRRDDDGDDDDDDDDAACAAPSAATCSYRVRRNAGYSVAIGPSIGGWCPADPASLAPFVDERQSVGNNGYGPNLGCPAPSTPLTSSRRAIMAAINGDATLGVDRVDAWSRGGTYGNFGLAWAWRMLSPRWTGLWRNAEGETLDALPRDYDTPYHHKIIVMMTDGANFHHQTDITAYGRPDEMLRRSEIDPSMLRLCKRIKDAGIVLYTITFGNVGDGTRATYASCASDPEADQRIGGRKYFDAPSGGELSDAFATIGAQLQALRLVQ